MHGQNTVITIPLIHFQSQSITLRIAVHACDASTAECIPFHKTCSEIAFVHYEPMSVSSNFLSIQMSSNKCYTEKAALHCHPPPSLLFSALNICIYDQRARVARRTSPGILHKNTNHELAASAPITTVSMQSVYRIAYILISWHSPLNAP